MHWEVGFQKGWLSIIGRYATSIKQNGASLSQAQSSQARAGYKFYGGSRLSGLSELRSLSEQPKQPEQTEK